MQSDPPPLQSAQTCRPPALHHNLSRSALWESENGREKKEKLEKYMDGHSHRPDPPSWGTAPCACLPGRFSRRITHERTVDLAIYALLLGSSRYLPLVAVQGKLLGSQNLQVQTRCINANCKICPARSKDHILSSYRVQQVVTVALKPIGVLHAVARTHAAQHKTHSFHCRREKCDLDIMHVKILFFLCFSLG